ncbi:MAG: nuclear transport factor 2 family protein [Acidobacteria bacterium]|nr:nuclear transport factor 2 family protein [Acidobacteriota bacterium]
MNRARYVAIFAAVLAMSSALARAQGAPQKSSGQSPQRNTAQAAASKTNRAQTTKAPAKSTAAKKAEAARRQKELAEMLIAQEKQAWEEEKNQNADFFRKVMTDQFVAAEPDGKRYTKAEVLPLIPTVRMTSFELTDFQVIRAGRDAAVLTYRATVRAPAEGKETSTSVLATTVWVRRGTVWKMTFHQKTLAPEKP